MDFTDTDVLNSVQHFAEQGFDEAANKWYAGGYSNDPQQSQAGYRRWKAMKERMRELLRQMKETAKSPENKGISDVPSASKRAGRTGAGNTRRP